MGHVTRRKRVHPDHAVGVCGLDVALWHGAQRTIEDFGGIGRCVEEQHDQSARPCAGQVARGQCYAKDVDARFGQGDKQFIGQKELDKEG